MYKNMWLPVWTSLRRERTMKDKTKNKTCATCIDNDNGLCDRKGILIHEDDTCDQHREDWRQRMMEKFDRRE